MITVKITGPSGSGKKALVERIVRWSQCNTAVIYASTCCEADYEKAKAEFSAQLTNADDVLMIVGKPYKCVRDEADCCN